MNNTYKLYTDGASKGNPGKASIGAWICDNQETVIKEISKNIGLATNNVAEYTALIEGLSSACELNIKNLQVFMDSELVVRQINGEYKIKNEGLLPLFMKVKELKSKFDHITFTHIERAKNKRADQLANLAI